MSALAAQLEVQVTGMRLEAEGVISLELRAPERTPLPAWNPGAHIDLLLPSGLVRQYSLCGDPLDNTRLCVAVLLEAKGRGGSREVHDGLRVGQRIAIRGPRNAFPLEAGQRYLFVAGGIGITPILAMARAAERAGADWQLVYGGRSRRSMAFIDELLALGGERVSIQPADETGLLDLEAIAALAADDRHTYSCGPAPLLDALSERFAVEGLAERLHLERFAPAAPAPGAANGQGLTLILARSGMEVPVADDRSVLQALRDAGCSVSTSCEQGVCGMCETRVLAGEVDHRDMLLTDAERARNNVMMVCVSRARTATLTLDL
ncbi:PDR/VanB family oxidoreductase [Metapseudomonas resinovorans]|uniref:Putative oxygenase electron transfer component n=1 Tax=Metapseudomonas resinovorans NBRC 106553 TaxID=1245471 RepID=S6AV93_METRE|nr:PDR/VanB family oxidoreductase [Pseudomonas resinovorans]BAN48361.1 putative oxygenase electron transfer component [Pseudomonas resinovorans NBRC 106553]